MLRKCLEPTVISATLELGYYLCKRPRGTHVPSLAFQSAKRFGLMPPFSIVYPFVYKQKGAIYEQISCMKIRRLLNITSSYRIGIKREQV